MDNTAVRSGLLQPLLPPSSSLLMSEDHAAKLMRKRRNYVDSYYPFSSLNHEDRVEVKEISTKRTGWNGKELSEKMQMFDEMIRRHRRQVMSIQFN